MDIEVVPDIALIFEDFINEKFPTMLRHVRRWENDCEIKLGFPEIGMRTIGWVHGNAIYTTYSHWNARKDYEHISLARPDFFEIFFIMCNYELGMWHGHDINKYFYETPPFGPRWSDS